MIKFLPGIPEKFHKSFQIQVAHFEPDTVNLLGEGVFPRISLDLPRSLEDDGQYEALVKDVREQLTTETKKTTGRPISAVSQQGNGHGAVVQVLLINGTWFGFMHYIVNTSYLIMY